MAPLLPDPSITSGLPVPSERLQPSGLHGRAHQRAKKVLVADDSSAVRQLAQRALSEAGYEVLSAVDGIDALAMLGQHTPDVLVCDVVMPRLDGVQTCMLVRRHPRYAGLPVVMLSTRQGWFDRARCALAGADEFVGKPFSAAGLLQVVDACINGSEGHDAAG